MKVHRIAVVLLILIVGCAKAVEKPHVVHVGTVAPDILSIQVKTGRVEYGRQQPYKKQRGDNVTDPNHNRWVYQNGKLLGSLVGPERKTLCPFDELVGAKLDTAWVDRADRCKIRSPKDPDYSKGLSPTAVHRKSKPSDLAQVGPWKFEAPIVHVLYLRLPKPLKVGKEYEVTFKGGGVTKQTFVYDPNQIQSEAVHVSQIGFRPDDPAKVAFLSCWMGSGGGVKYKPGLRFQVFEHGSGKPVFEGKITLSKAADDKTEDAYDRNYNGVDVYEMDFSSLQVAGTYRVSVEGIGCSHQFEIDKDVWREAFTVSARGLFHQRSGIALGPPHTSFVRPRGFHPDDGTKVYASTAALIDTGNGLNEQDTNFGNLLKGRTETVIPDAWGGYMDAGDWDRRIQHLDVSRLLLELAGLFPNYFVALSLNIPESGGDLPDIVDEALFNLDCYRRMQTAEGGIRGGIESAEHPGHGEGSWQESHRIMAYAPGVWSSYLYAGVAARAAHWLELRQATLAKVYRDSAVRAMRWAESELSKNKSKEYPHQVNDARNLAAAELFRLTGEVEWHDLFLATTFFKVSGMPVYKYQSHEQRDAAWVYVRTGRPGIDTQVKQNCRDALIREAEERAAGCSKTGFRWTKDPYRPVAWGALTVPDAIGLVRAHAVTGKLEYLRAAVLSCQTGAGANPPNVCYTTGLGWNNPRHPLHVDSRISRQPPPPGITISGPCDPKWDDANWIELVRPYCHPPPDEWPVIEAFWDVFWHPYVCEYTVHTTMAPNAYVWGYLAARE